MAIEELENLEIEFGDITFPAYDCGLKVPLGVMKFVFGSSSFFIQIW